MYTPVHLLHFHEILINLLPFFDTYFHTAIRASMNDDTSLLYKYLQSRYLITILNAAVLSSQKRSMDSPVLREKKIEPLQFNWNDLLMFPSWPTPEFERRKRTRNRCVHHRLTVKISRVFYSVTCDYIIIHASPFFAVAKYHLRAITLSFWWSHLYIIIIKTYNSNYLPTTGGKRLMEYVTIYRNRSA